MASRAGQRHGHGQHSRRGDTTHVHEAAATVTGPLEFSRRPPGPWLRAPGWGNGRRGRGALGRRRSSGQGVRPGPSLGTRVPTTLPDAPFSNKRGFRPDRPQCSGGLSQALPTLGRLVLVKRPVRPLSTVPPPSCPRGDGPQGHPRTDAVSWGLALRIIWGREPASQSWEMPGGPRGYPIPGVFDARVHHLSPHPWWVRTGSSDVTNGEGVLGPRGAAPARAPPWFRGLFEHRAHTGGSDAWTLPTGSLWSARSLGNSKVALAPAAG